MEQRVELLLIGVIMPGASALPDAENSAQEVDMDEPSNTTEVIDGKNSFEIILF